MAFIFLFLACGPSESQIAFRIRNDTGYPISKFRLGRLIMKYDSYQSSSYQTIFRNISAGATTPYRYIKLGFPGYDCGWYYVDGHATQFLHKSDFQRETSNFPQTEKKFPHPYDSIDMHGQQLLPGKYTLILQPSQPMTMQRARFDLVRDD